MNVHYQSFAIFECFLDRFRFKKWWVWVCRWMWNLLRFVCERSSLFCVVSCNSSAYSLLAWSRCSSSSSGIHGLKKGMPDGLVPHFPEGFSTSLDLPAGDGKPAVRCGRRVEPCRELVHEACASTRQKSSQGSRGGRNDVDAA